MVQPIILEKLEQLSESLQTEVLHYIEFCLNAIQKRMVIRSSRVLNRVD